MTSTFQSVTQPPTPASAMEIFFGVLLFLAGMQYFQGYLKKNQHSIRILISDSNARMFVTNVCSTSFCTRFFIAHIMGSIWYILCACCVLDLCVCILIFRLFTRKSVICSSPVFCAFGSKPHEPWILGKIEKI